MPSSEVESYCPSCPRPRIGRMIKRLGVRHTKRAGVFLDILADISMNHSDRCRSFSFKPRCRVLVVLAGMATFLLIASPVRASGGPENVLLVVNPTSPDSLCIANHYAALRHIPPGNFFFLDWDAKQENTDIETFREKILLPVLRVAKMSVPGRQIDYIVYSSGFPWGIRIDEDIKRFKAALEKREEGKEGKSVTKSPMWTTFTPLASINGLTYLWEWVAGNRPYVDPHSNWYARTGAAEQANEPTLAFSSSTAFGPHGEIENGRGCHYMLSMMLGVTSRAGQFAGRGARIPGPQRRGRRHASPRDHLLRAERRHSLQGPPGRISGRGEEAESPGR